MKSRQAMYHSPGACTRGHMGTQARRQTHALTDTRRRRRRRRHTRRHKRRHIHRHRHRHRHNAHPQCTRVQLFFAHTNWTHNTLSHMHTHTPMHSGSVTITLHTHAYAQCHTHQNFLPHAYTQRNTRTQTQTQIQTQDTRHKTQDTRHKTQDTRHRLSRTNLHRNLNAHKCIYTHSMHATRTKHSRLSFMHIPNRNTREQEENYKRARGKFQNTPAYTKFKHTHALTAAVPATTAATTSSRLQFTACCCCIVEISK